VAHCEGLNFYFHLKPQFFVPSLSEESKQRAELVFSEGSVSAIDVFFSGYPKSLDLIFIYLSGLMISNGNFRFLKHVSIKE